MNGCLLAGSAGIARIILNLTAFAGSAAAQTTVLWEAFNDYAPTPGITSDFATGYELRVADSGGPLRNIATGDDLQATVLVVVEGGIPDAFGANSRVNAGSPADQLFGGKVDIGNDGLPGVRASAATKLTLLFSGLDPAKRYNFRGTVSRGGGYNDRWSLFTLSGAGGFVAAHEDGSVNKNIITKATFPAATLEPNQVALNSGDNKAGSLVGWNTIEPAGDGTFAIDAEQYLGPTPFGKTSAAPYGYGFSALYLAETEATGALRITENPLSQRVPAGRTATLNAAATSPSPITYQWQRAAAGSDTFLPVAGANQPTYVTPVLTVGDSGAQFRCLVSSGPNETTTTAATLLVDGALPTVASATASVNFNAVYLVFSEAMNLESLADAGHYQLSDGLTVESAVALEPTVVKLVTSPQTPGHSYAATISQVTDLAGNAIAPASPAPFTAFVLRSGVVGLEIWNSVLGAAVTDLVNDSRYPAEPDRDVSGTSFDSIPVLGDSAINTYGARMRAWLTPSVSGDYEFFIRADDAGDLRLGVDDSFEALETPDAVPIATDTTTGDSFQEPGVDLSTSVPIPLVAGQRYALQALWKEANGADHCQVAWRLVGDATPAADLPPLSGDQLSYFGPATGGLPPTLRISFAAQKVIVEWSGGVLESSGDLKTWTPQPAAVSPLAITPTQPTFYRVRP